MRVPIVLVALVPIALAAAGCLAPADPGAIPAASEASGDARTPPVVVAVIDNGITPYHASFLAGPDHATFADVPGFPADAAPVALALGEPDFDAAVAADDEEWRAIEPETLVVFPGTRLAAAWFAKSSEEARPIVDDGGHGTPVADAVLEASPHAVVLMLQINDDEDIVPAMLWAAAQPWIDIVSVSWGKYVPEYAEEPDMGLADAYREAARAGKILVNSAGNEPTVHWTDEHSAPPFVVAVGGAMNATHGETRTASRFPDVIAAFVQTRAVAHTLDERAPTAGTSFSCPTVSGTLAEALWLVRDAGGSATAGELRAAMNRRAETWDASAWSPDGATNANPIVAPAAQMGWGFVEAAQAADIAAFLLGELDLPEKPAETVAFMQAREEARRAAWGDV